uniref:Uncharacterized protein n=1 Tax=Anguilla anguilla TaxID=7936 RepID=A0A0E9XCP2_ANGAN
MYVMYWDVAQPDTICILFSEDEI